MRSGSPGVLQPQGRAADAGGRGREWVTSTGRHAGRLEALEGGFKVGAPDAGCPALSPASVHVLSPMRGIS